MPGNRPVSGTHSGPGQQLLAVIGVGLGAFDVHIPTAQPCVEIRKDADLKRPPLEHRLQATVGPDEGLPADTGKVERNLCGDIVTTGVLEALNKGKCIEQRAGGSRSKTSAGGIAGRVPRDTGDKSPT